MGVGALQISDLQKGLNGQPVALLVRALFADGDAAKVHGFSTVISSGVDKGSGHLRGSSGAVAVADRPEICGNAVNACTVGLGERRTSSVIDDLGRLADRLAIDVAQCECLDDFAVARGQRELAVGDPRGPLGQAVRVALQQSGASRLLIRARDPRYVVSAARRRSQVRVGRDDHGGCWFDHEIGVADRDGHLAEQC